MIVPPGVPIPESDGPAEGMDGVTYPEEIWRGESLLAAGVDAPVGGYELAAGLVVPAEDDRVAVRPTTYVRSILEQGYNDIRVSLGTSMPRMLCCRVCVPPGEGAGVDKPPPNAGLGRRVESATELKKR